MNKLLSSLDDKHIENSTGPVLICEKEKGPLEFANKKISSLEDLRSCSDDTIESASLCDAAAGSSPAPRA